ncbi:hypothetical protein niasHS_012299 [Heterodera schachtii]|uniref:Uncharacterized protein n=2 Tax=Heterodera TaxID=34509 RepID=A0ABD2IWG7_HETSC
MLQATRTQQLLPTISEEFYEVIDDETAAEPRPNVLPPPHFDHKTSANFQRPPKMVQLPLSNKCDHCFLRVQGDDRCSVAVWTRQLRAILATHYSLPMKMKRILMPIHPSTTITSTTL